MSEPIKNRYEFIYMFDAEKCNPNGDPDSGNMPRIDPETVKGIVTDVCLKRKIRNYIQTAKRNMDGKPEDRFDIFVKEGAVLNNEIQSSYQTETYKEKEKELIEGLGKKKDDKEISKKLHDHLLKEGKEKIAQAVMCDTYFDIRTFGAVMSTGETGDQKAGVVRGPVQLSFSETIERIFSLDPSISCIAPRSEKNIDMKGIIGRKPYVPYGLYLAKGFVSANLARKSGFSDNDLDLLWVELERLFDDDNSAAHHGMAARKLIVFKHVPKDETQPKEDQAKNAMLGNAPAHKLFEMVKVYRVGEGGELLDPDDKDDAKKIDKLPPARKFTDYKVLINDKDVEPMDKFDEIPGIPGVQMQVKI